MKTYLPIIGNFCSFYYCLFGGVPLLVFHMNLGGRSINSFCWFNVLTSPVGFLICLIGFVVLFCSDKALMYKLKLYPGLTLGLFVTGFVGCFAIDFIMSNDG